MRLKLGTLLLSTLVVSTMSAQTPTAVEEIYSQIGVASLSGGNTVVYSFGSWHAGNMDSNISLLPALFDQLLSESGPTTMVEGVFADVDGINMSWNSVEKLISVNCESDKLGRTSVLIAEMNGATRGVVTVNDTSTQISLSDYAPGVYAVALAVDGKLIKTLKINLK